MYLTYIDKYDTIASDRPFKTSNHTSIMSEQITLVSVIGTGYKPALVKKLKQAGFETLQDCAENPRKLRSTHRIGTGGAYQAIKNHCFKRCIVWNELSEDYNKEATVSYFMRRYEVDQKTAEEITCAFFWEDAAPYCDLNTTFLPIPHNVEIIPLTDVIGTMKKVIEYLSERGINTLQDCGQNTKTILHDYTAVGYARYSILKELCFRNGIEWNENWRRSLYWISEHGEILHLMKRYKVDYRTAREISHAFYWDNAAIHLRFDF